MLILCESDIFMSVLCDLILLTQIYYGCVRELVTQAGRERSMYEAQAICNCGSVPIPFVVY